MLGRKYRHRGRDDSYEAYEPPAATVAETKPGVARGPALLLGTLLTAAGLILFLEAGSTPTGSFPDGDATGTEFLGIATNGWTAWFTTAAGALLLLGAAQHLLARVTSLLVGLALAACVVISLIDGDDVFGLAFANEWTQLGWGIPAALLLLNSLVPRARHRRREVEDRDRLERDRVIADGGRERDRVTADERDRVTADGGRESAVGEADDVRTGEDRPIKTGRFDRETIPPPRDSEGKPVTPLSRRRSLLSRRH